MTWTQVYAPIAGNIWLSSLAAIVPILFFFWALAIKRMKGHQAGILTVVLSVLVAVLVYQMPVSMALSATVYGLLFGLWPISWIIIAAVFLYKITVKSGQFDIIRSSVVSITDDQRLQAILIAFSFGAFIEGAAGFGAPVAISAGLLAGLGFNPVYAAGLALIANTAPVAFGSIGIPITTVGKITGLDPNVIGAIVGRQLPFLAMLIPFWLVAIMDGKKGLKETWPAALVAGVTFASAQFLTSNYIGPELPDIAASLFSLIATGVFLKFWKPKNVFRFDTEESRKAAEAPRGGHTGGQIVKAWSPFIILTIMVSFASMNSVKNALAFATFNFNFPGLHRLVIKAAPVVAKPTPYDAVFSLNLLTAVGTTVFVTALITMFIVGMKFSEFLKTFGETLYELRYPALTIASVLAFANIANYSGQSATLGLAFAATGVLFPFFSPILGWLGVFLTGSDTSSNALFGNLQKVTAGQIGVDPHLLVAANSSGGVTGKMISPQSIAVATAATGIAGKESDLLRFTFKHSIILAVMVGIMTMIQAYLIPEMVHITTFLK